MKPPRCMLQYATTATTLLFVILLTATACNSHTAQRHAHKPIAEIGRGRILRITDQMLATGGSDTVRFGRLHSGEIAVMHLWIANETERPLVISDYLRSCGCTTLEFDNQPILSGEAKPVTLTFDSRGERGWQLKTVDILSTESPCSLRLFVEADVE